MTECPYCSQATLQSRGTRKLLKGVSRRYWCSSCSKFSRQLEGVPQEAPTVEVPNWVPKHKRLVITWAQNATPVHRPTLQALEDYCRLNDARLVVIPGRYKNPTSVVNDASHDDWWDALVVPYLTKARIPFGPNCQIHGEISIQPTAARPLSGFEVFAGKASAIFGHPKIQLETVATEKRYYPRIFASTGAVTIPNYTDSKAGKKGEAHHCYGAVVLEQDGKLFHLRHLRPDSKGVLYDLEYVYQDGKRDFHDGVAAVVYGDWHAAKLTPEGQAAAHRLADELRPQNIVLHDVFDMDSRNHHRSRDWLDKIRRRYGHSTDKVEDEVLWTFETLDELADKAEKVWVVRSNHDEALHRWLVESDHRQDPANARFAYSLLAQMAAAAERGQSVDPLELCYDHAGAGRLKFLKRNQSLKICGIECGFHGDKGINGARGTINAYAKLGAKTVTGHSHTPYTRDGAMSVGVAASLEQGYNHLMSTWLNSHVVIYPNGKRTHVHVIEGRYK